MSRQALGVESYREQGRKVQEEQDASATEQQQRSTGEKGEVGSNRHTSSILKGLDSVK
jgi:hypothetical protein